MRLLGFQRAGFQRGGPAQRPTVSRGVGFALVAYSFVITMLGTTMPTPLYPIYQARYGFSGFMITVIFAVYAAGVIAGLLLFGSLSDQVGRRRVLLVGVLLSAASAVVFLLAGGLPTLLVGRVLSGLSAGVFTGNATAALLDLAPPASRGRAGLVAAAMNMGGLGVGPVLAGFLAEYAPAPLTLCFLADLVLIAAAAVGLWFIPEPITPPDRPRWRPQRVGVPAATRPTFVRAVIAGFAGFSVLGLFTAISPSFLGKVLGVHDHAVTGLVVFSLLAASTVGQTLVGLTTERRALLAGCAVLAAGGGIIALSLDVRSLSLLVLGAVIAGLGQGASFRAGLTAVGNASPADRRAEVSSSFFVVVYIAISLPVVGVGAAEQAFGLVPAGIGLSATVAVLALIAFASLLRQQSQRSP